jgi:hypothetical protein
MLTIVRTYNGKRRDLLKDLGIDRKIILKCILRVWDGVWTGLILFRIETITKLL